MIKLYWQAQKRLQKLMNNLDSVADGYGMSLKSSNTASITGG